MQKHSKACKPRYLAVCRLLWIISKLANHGSNQHKYPLKSSTNSSTRICIFRCWTLPFLPLFHQCLHAYNSQVSCWYWNAPSHTAMLSGSSLCLPYASRTYAWVNVAKYVASWLYASCCISLQVRSVCLYNSSIIEDSLYIEVEWVLADKGIIDGCIKRCLQRAFIICDRYNQRMEEWGEKLFSAI